jgi:transaldolase
MQLLLDSAIIDDAIKVSKWGWVYGATTNPTLLALSNLSPEKTLLKMSKCFKGPVFYQLIGKTIDSMESEAKLASDILGKKLVLKIPATELGFLATNRLSKTFTCAVTSIFTPAQAMVAHVSGACYALYYHNRAKKLLTNGKRLASELVKVLKNTSTKVVAASLKSPEEVVEARLAGVSILSTSYKVLSEMVQHDLSDSALQDFNQKGIGLISQ